MKQSRTQFQNRLLILFFSGMLIWHFFTLNISPLPWFDEVFFASITRSFSEGRGFIPEVVPFQAGRQVFTYGPVYFILTGLSTTLFGFGIFSFRLVNFIFGIATVYLVFRILEKQQLPSWVFVLTMLVFCLDPRYLQNIHNGRMDQVALFFSVFSLYVFLYTTPRAGQIPLIALSLTLAMLTTPRFFFIVIPLGLFVVFNLIMNKKWLNLSFFLLIPSVLALAWIFHSFGSPGAAWDYYSLADNQRNATLFSRFLGGNFRIAFYQYPMIVSSLVLVVFSFRKLATLPIAWLSMTFLLLFYLLIFDTGLYSSIIVVFFYVLMGLGAKFASRKWLAYVLLISVFIVNGFIFSFKSLTILTQFNERSPQTIEDFVKKNVPPNARVVGDERYYYAFEKNRCQFQYINRGGLLAERVEYHKNRYNAGFVMLSIETDSEIIRQYRESFEHFREVPFNINKHHGRLKTLLNRMNPMDNYGTYEGVLLVAE